MLIRVHFPRLLYFPGAIFRQDGFFAKMVVGDVFNCDIKRPSDATFVPFEVVRRVLNDWCARGDLRH